MSNWLDKYIEFNNFSLLEAAFLWEEIEPTPELIKNPPIIVIKRKEQINKEINEYIRQQYLSKFNQYLAKGKTHQEAIETLIRKHCYLGMTKKELYVEILATFEGEKKVRDKSSDISIPESFILELRLFLNGQDIISPSEISRDFLVKIAQRAGINPKFLFPDIESMSKWETGGASRQKYQELIKVLCKSLKIDITSRDAVGKILVMAQSSSSTLSENTIRKIIDEVEPSRLKNSHRRTRKTQNLD